MNKLLDEIKKTTVFLGRITAQKMIELRATGFLVSIKEIFHLVTAKHVVMEMKGDKFTERLIDDGLCVFFNTKANRIGIRSIKQIKERFNVDWIFHENQDVDIAIIPFGLDPEGDDVKTIPENLFLGTDQLFELYDIFFMSYQPGIAIQQKICPIVRTGTISLINEDKTFYIDAFAFPGNSGSPVFLKPSPIRFDKKSDKNVISIGGDKLGGRFVGIIGEYIPYEEVAISAQTGHPRVVFEENTGLSKVWSVTFINEVTKSEKFRKQIEKLTQNKSGQLESK